MTSDAVRVYLTEAIARGMCNYDWDEAPQPTRTFWLSKADTVLAVVETLRTPCPQCEGSGTDTAGLSDASCDICGGTGLSALLAFDEMRGMEQVGWYHPDAATTIWGLDHYKQYESMQLNSDVEPVYRFPAALLSPDTTETP